MYAFLGFIAILAFATSVYFIVKAIRGKYTKSRFAFLALTSLSSVVSLIVITLLSGETPFQSLLRLVFDLFGVEYTPQGPGLLQLVGLCFVTWVLYSFASSTFKNWDGPETIDQHKRSIRKEDESLLLDGLTELKRITTRGPAPELYQELDSKPPSLEIKTPDDSLAWHIQACELVSLVKPDLFFDIATGWIQELSCWHGESKSTGGTAILQCTINDVSITELSSLLRRTEELSPAVSHRPIVIVAVREPVQPRTATIDGIDVEIYSEEALLAQLINFKDYFYEIRRRVEIETLPESDLTIIDTYEVSDYTIEGEINSRENVERFLFDWLSDPSRRQIALLGEYGQGKSTLSLLFAYQIIKNYGTSNRIPIIIELRGKSPAAMTPEELLSSWSVNYQIKSTALKKLLISGRILLILEGFDEMAFLGDSETRINHFKTLWALNYPKSKILITGRPNFFLDDTEMKAALGIIDPVLGKPYCQAIHLAPFDTGKISSSLREFPLKTREEISLLVKRSGNFRDLASRPSLLYLIAILWERENLTQYGEDINSALIMGLFISYVYSRQHAKEESSKRFMFLNEAERSFFMNGVAAFMAGYDLPNQIRGIALRELVTDLLVVIPNVVSTKNSAMQVGYRTPLKERINDEEEKLEQLQTDVRSCGILVRDVSATGTLKFSHKSFMEYLAAEVASSYLLGSDESSALLAGINRDAYQIVASEEILAFFSELLKNSYIESEKCLAEHMLDLIAGTDKSNVKRFLRLAVANHSIKSGILRAVHTASYFPLFFVPTFGVRVARKAAIWDLCCMKLDIATVEMEKVTTKGAARIFDTRRARFDNITGRLLVRARIQGAPVMAVQVLRAFLRY